MGWKAQLPWKRLILPKLQSAACAAEARALEQQRKRILSNHRCCCAEVDSRCLWYKNSLLTNKLLSNGHCPRLQQRGNLPACAAQSCGLIRKEGCTKTHQSLNACF